MSHKALITHHLNRALNGARYNALRNCHAAGVDSIVLHDEPGNRVRVFLAGWLHTLWRNRQGAEFSVAIHSHHCDLVFSRLHGDVYNELYALVPRAQGSFGEFKYTSGVTGEASLTESGNRAEVVMVSSEKIGDVCQIAAYQLHTVRVPVNTAAAWLVIEGKEDPDYSAMCWTNAKDFSATGMYERMDQDAVVRAFDDLLRRID